MSRLILQCDINSPTVRYWYCILLPLPIATVKRISLVSTLLYYYPRLVPNQMIPSFFVLWFPLAGTFCKKQAAQYVLYGIELVSLQHHATVPWCLCSAR